MNTTTIITSAAQEQIDILFPTMAATVIAAMVDDAQRQPPLNVFSAYRYEQEGHNFVVVIPSVDAPISVLTAEEYEVMESAMNQIAA